MRLVEMKPVERNKKGNAGGMNRGAPDPPGVWRRSRYASAAALFTIKTRAGCEQAGKSAEFGPVPTGRRPDAVLLGHIRVRLSFYDA
jgi:hypothetical protein